MVGIDLTNLPAGSHSRTLTPAPEDLDLDPEAFRDVAVEAHLDHQPERTLVTFTVAAEATLECDRTLEPFQERVSGSYAVLFVPPEHVERYGENGEDVRPLPEPNEPLDLTEPVRDTLLLALPVRRVAPGAEELDIPTTFGAIKDADGTPLDPRWEALRKLRDDP